VADVAVGVVFDAVGVVAAAFDRAGAGAFPAWVAVAAYLVVGRGESGVQVLRG
jgi:hypothetical protein